VIDVRGEPRVGLGIIERVLNQDLFDGIGGRLNSARAREVLGKRFANEVAQRHPAGAGGLGGPPMKVAGQQELGPVHV
jgi:hypothetical protein